MNAKDIDVETNEAAPSDLSDRKRQRGATNQGLTLVHFSSQLRHFLTDTLCGLSSVLQARWVLTHHKLDTARHTD
jgi:hypothetical protein